MPDKKINIGASCTWGEGPDIMLVMDDKPFICYEDLKKGRWKHGYVTKGSTDLTQQEARDLAASLLTAADACKALEDSYEEHVANGGDTRMISINVQIPEEK